MSHGGFCRAFEQDIVRNASLLRREALPRSRTMRRRWGRASMSRPGRGKGECHARENGWLALSTLALQYQRHISRVLQLRADADAAHAQDIAHMDRERRYGDRRHRHSRCAECLFDGRSLMQRLVSPQKGKTCSARPNRGDSQSTRATPEMSRKISTTRRNLVSSIRSKRRSPSHVPATTAGKHQK